MGRRGLHLWNDGSDESDVNGGRKLGSVSLLGLGVAFGQSSAWSLRGARLSVHSSSHCMHPLLL
jgi:hypothetical protein